MQEVKATQDRVHSQLVADVALLETSMLALLKSDPYNGAHGALDAVVVNALTAFVNDRAAYVVSEWQKLLPRLIST